MAESYPYQVKKGEGIYSLAREVLKKAGVEENAPDYNKMLGEVKTAIENDLKKQGIEELQLGQTIQLYNIDYYLPGRIYQVKEGDGYWAIAKHVQESTGKDECQRNNVQLRNKLATAIQNDLKSQGILKLEPGQIIELKSIDGYLNPSPSTQASSVTETVGAQPAVQSTTDRAKRRQAEEQARAEAERIEERNRASGGNNASRNAESGENAEENTDRKKVIILDPGHGGRDPGATYKGIKESEIVRKLAKVIYNKLSNYTVHPTRSLDKNEPVDDYDGNKRIGYDEKKDGNEQKDSLLDRVAFANNMKDPKPTLFLSLHVNSFHTSSPRGMNAYISNSSKGKKSDQFLRLLQKQLKTDGFIFHGEFRVVKDYDVVALTDNIPAVLFEIGFLSNELDRELLSNDMYLEKIALSIKKAIDAYFVDEIKPIV